MASLTEVSIISRKIIRYTIYFIIFIIIARFTINVGTKIYKIIFPPPKPKPTVSFGKLPKLPFPPKSLPQNLSFTLELTEGKLPAFPDQMEVYPMPKPQPRIEALDEAKQIARFLEFDPNGKVINDKIPNVYIFNKKDFPSTLTMNIVTQVFSISYNLETDPLVLLAEPPEAKVATNLFTNLLSKAGIFYDDLRTGHTSSEYLRIEKKNFTSAISLSEAHLTKVNIFRGPYGNENYPSVTPKMPQANIWAIFAGGKNNQIIASEFHYFPIDKNTKATYPIKNSQTAWEELKQGKAYIANLGNNPNGNIIIRRAYLAYYDAGQDTPYYQPVVVFEGDNNFYAYVPAVTDEFYGL